MAIEQVFTPTSSPDASEMARRIVGLIQIVIQGSSGLRPC
jgi:hypothetical protein